MTMKMRLKMKNRSSRYDINRPRHRHGRYPDISPWQIAPGQLHAIKFPPGQFPPGLLCLPDNYP